MSRETQAAGTPRRGVVRRVLDIRLGSLLKWLLAIAVALIVIGLVGFAVFVFWPTRTIPDLEPVDEYVALGQGWGDALDSPERQTYYYTPQGTVMPQGSLLAPLRYAWFVKLEMPFSKERFTAPDHMRRYRFVVDPQPTARNPDHLPVGFTRHFDAGLGEYVLDITCAACHTGEVHAQRNGRTVAIRIDGGQAMHAFTDMQRGSFGPTLIASLAATYLNPVKFNRFARRVLGPRYPQGKGALRGALWDNIVAFASLGQNNPLRQLYPAVEGFGRTDALGRIANTVFGDHLSASNYRDAVAPVSYPYLWNIWKFDWVQYNGSVRQPLARNVGEALGVGAVLRMTDTYGNPLPSEERFRSSVDMDSLQAIERTLQTLTPPRWPEDLLGKVDHALAARGGELFDQRCRMCHGPHVASAAQQRAGAPGKPSAEDEWLIEVVPLSHVGTDPAAATAFMENRFDLSATGLTAQELSGLLKPLLIRDLARDARLRLDDVVAGRAEEGLEPGSLPELLATYPDPDADPEPSLPAATFEAIASELERLGVDSGAQAIEPPSFGFECDLDCQTRWLSWDVHGAAAHIDRSVGSMDIRKLTNGEGLNVLGLLIKRRYYEDHAIDYATRQCLEGFGALDLPQQIAGYKPRPLAGIWATPPFVHNGSVPTIYEMLLPPEQRRARFLVGYRDYDAKRLGYVVEPAGKDEDSGFWFDTTLPGNRNTGHAFVADPAEYEQHRTDPAKYPLPPGVIGPLLSDDERWAIVEYLKVHRDPPTSKGFRPIDCSAPPAPTAAPETTPASAAAAGAP